MSYKYEDSVKILVNNNAPLSDKLMEELNEVYAKSKAWDEFIKRTLMMIDELPRDFQDSNKQIEFHKKALFVMNQCYRAVTHVESEVE